jgi:hypothetical protein
LEAKKTQHIVVDKPLIFFHSVSALAPPRELEKDFELKWVGGEAASTK